MMPKRGGYEVLRGLQAIETSGIPIIVITARHIDHTTEKMIRGEPNVADLVIKSFNSAVVIKILHKVLRTKPSVDIESLRQAGELAGSAAL